MMCYRSEQDLARNIAERANRAASPATSKRELVFQQFLGDYKSKRKTEYVSPLRLAGHAVRAGKREEALGYLEEACEQHDPFIVILQHDPQFDGLRVWTRGIWRL
ncbi:MAG TPA: hypothetical protein VKD70_04525 [Candidatus Acidoferrum sp.]|nr:hypothetical protein [Candidatus Acidoferrum sp.]